MGERMASDRKLETPISRIEVTHTDYERRIRLLLDMLAKEKISPEERAAGLSTMEWLKKKLDAKL